MKTLLVALLLAMLLMSGSALKCNRCVPRPGGRCTTTTETCSFNQDACVSGMFTRFPFTYFKRCIKLSECLIMQRTSYINARCCQSDRCN
ncbi:phospholipase A2 inhibitor and Ly6/PLAUR domain-containing protein-like [Colossoma macropomum]|uniref:phospholipase A2 inhibitor and Ly6/PLAUR domain-containing protein-like n=1 Tax=Colossoma macropomum TaxID=42526 RepID=UPI0018644693|nr:phospholipase A2 inhibitor and Ly6/PLAUR domain-containing protein-like [Colossoma macropomum]